MESDVILQGFLEAEKKHGVRYMRVVGDGDSSVFAKIREEVPGLGRSVKKEECANHVSKCYRSNLEKLVTDNRLYKGRHHLSKTTRVRLVSALRCAIRVRSKEFKEKKYDKPTAIKKLNNDIRNSVHHVFGQHDQCSDFCQAKNQTAPTYNPSDTDNNETEEARGGTTIDYSNVEQHIIRDVTLILNRIAEKSDRLLGKSTTNLAESWMHIRTKFDGANSTRYKSKPSVHQLRWKKKFSSLKTSTTRKATRAYGPEATDVVEDVSATVLQKLQDNFLQTHINLSAQQCKNITTSTFHQSQSGLWHSERKKRITASNFGSIVKRNPSLPIAKFVRTILYSSFSGNRHTRNGINQEDTTIEDYKLKKAEENENVSVERSGLVIHHTDKYLAASPDGIVTISTGETGIIKIKDLLHSKPLNLWQASENKTFCL
ncbi:Hypothetical predicted protein [Mytilus galloprovincialis]|uniref:YqaJ viral recombinase domain-containing protein n=1 Tax=Mytilus galloprovincialis TaxID=29158 RepID=A0A8B6D4M9_MYTGA|nr:Hypothetical predicted protein [Mytilus galloprovincialis]